MTDSNGPVKSHHHSVSVSRGSRHQTKDEMQGSRGGSATTQVFPLLARFKVPAVRSQSSEEACCWSSCQGNHRQLFQDYAHLSSHCGDVSFRFGPPHKLSLYTLTHLPVSVQGRILTHTRADTDKSWHCQEWLRKRIFLTLCICTLLLSTPFPVLCTYGIHFSWLFCQAAPSIGHFMLTVSPVKWAKRWLGTWFNIPYSYLLKPFKCLHIVMSKLMHIFSLL